MTDKNYVAQYDALPIGTEFIVKSKYGDSFRKISETHIINFNYPDKPFAITRNSKKVLVDGKSWGIQIPYSATPKRPIKWV